MVHTFQRGGISLALDTGSGAVHVLDELSYYLLSQLDADALQDEALVKACANRQYSAESLVEAAAELNQLVQQGVLFSDDSYAEFAEELGVAPVKAMCLHVAHDCNLRCRYCFASTGDFGGGRALMPFDVAKRAIDLLVENSGSRKNLEVDFFGGEPLMNFEVVRQTVDYARSLEKENNKRFRFTITTNGLLLNDETITYINREMGNVVLSLDGRQAVNDRMRPCIGGTGSYDIILPKLQKLVAARGDKEYYVRGTYTRNNLDFDADVLSLFENGFDQISVEPVVGPETDDYTIREADIAAIDASYERLMQDMAARRKKGEARYNFFHFMIDLDNGPCAIKRLKGCGCGNEYLAVTPEGDLYPCHQFVGDETHKMGTVYGGIAREDMRETFAAANVLNKPECQSCWAKFFCSGGCNANNHQYCGAITSPHKMSCVLEKNRLECAITLQAMAVLE